MIEVLVKEAIQTKERLEEMNKPKDIRNLVKTFEDACEILGVCSDLSYLKSPYLIAHEKLVIIFKVLNEGWTPNWSDSNEYKYYPWFKMSPFGFADSAYGAWTTRSLAGSRLCGKTDTIAEYAGRQFVDIYKDFYN